MDHQLHGDDVCFDTKISFEAGCWLLFAAALCYIFVGSIAMSVCRSVIRDRSASATVHDSKAQRDSTRMTRFGIWLGVMHEGHNA